MYFLQNVSVSVLQLSAITILFFGIFTLAISTTIPSALAESQTVMTEKGTLNINWETEPENPKSDGSSKLQIEFTNPITNKTQEHIDYTLKIENNGNFKIQFRQSPYKAFISLVKIVIILK